MSYLIGGVIVLIATLIMSKHVRTNDTMATVVMSAVVSMILFMLSIWSLIFNDGVNL